MYNLIVSGQIENANKGKILASRVLEYTDDTIKARFMPNNKFDLDSALKLPTIIMEEGTGNEQVYIVDLKSIKHYDSNYVLTYSICSDIPFFTNKNIETMKEELEIDEWEFNRNHWSIKDVDLFRVLLTSKKNPERKPTVFKLSEKPMKSGLVSLMMPFTAEFNGLHETIKSTLETNNFQCKRADNFWENHHIMQDIIELICTSNIVICDLTGKNPNVFYEAGIAHTLGKEVILITQSDDDVPFDLKPIRYIKYLNNQEGLEKLARELLERVLKVT